MKKNEISLEGVNGWDLEKSELVYQLLNKKYDDELDVSKSFQTRAVFFITTLGVIFSILLTSVRPNMSEENPMVAFFIIVLIILATAAILYLITIYLQERISFPSRYPSDEDMEKIATTHLSKKDILHDGIQYLYEVIEKTDKRNRKSWKFSKAADIAYIIALIITIIYAYQSAQIAESVQYFLLFLGLILCIVLADAFSVIQIIIMLPSTIRNTKRIYLKAREIHKAKAKQKVKITK